MYIAQLELKGFKSFRQAVVSFLPSFNAIAGPNGSGKSNICDAIKFVFGESSLSSLRARSVKDLVHERAKVASVKAILINGNETLEIERKIDQKGRVGYYLNGKRLTRKDYVSFLLRHGISSGSHMIIMQGQITKFVSMNKKERRKLLTDAAGIGEYELKKEEALKELDLVDARIREASLVYGERMKYLEELKKEIEATRKYRKLQQELKNIRYTLRVRQLKKTQNEYCEKQRQLQELLEKKNDLEKKRAEVKKKIENIENEKQRYAEVIKQKAERNQLYLELERKKTELEKEWELLREKEQTHYAKGKEAEILKDEISALQEEIRKLKNEESTVSKALSKMNVSEKERKYASLVAEIDALESEVSQLEKENTRLEERKSILLEKLNSLVEEGIDLSSIQKRLIESFRKEKEINLEIQELDRRMAEVREKLAVLRAEAARFATADLIKELKKTTAGIYDFVFQLIEFDEKFAKAVEAIGSRLNYLVVENLDVAKKVIEAVKRMKLGRITIIPLKELKVSSPQGVSVGLGLLKNYVSIRPGLEKVLDYVFGDLVLVESFEEAKQYLGKYRMVTLDGEIFEKTAVVSGGRTGKSIISLRLLSQLEQEISVLKDKRAKLISKLNEIREEVETLREEKAKLEAKKEIFEKAKKEREQLNRELSTVSVALSKISSELSNKKSILAKLKKEKAKMEEELKIERKKMIERAKLEEKGKMLVALLAEKESLLKNKLDKLKSLAEEIERERAELRARSDFLRMKEMEVKTLEGQLSELNREIDEYLRKTRELDEKIADLAREMKRYSDEVIRIERQEAKLSGDIHALKLRISDLERELGDGELLELSDELLEKRMREVEEELSAMGNINFAAEESYEKLSEEVKEVKAKIEKLQEERESLLELIAEIEQKKKKVFLEFLERLNSHFSKLTEMLPGFGKGEVVVEDKKNPFASGVIIRLWRSGRPVRLEALSGGEQTLLAIMFIFSMNMSNPSPIYIFDEVDAALDTLNVERLAGLIRDLSKRSQFIVVSHNEELISKADSIIAVAKVQGVSKIAEIKPSQVQKVVAE